MNPPNRGRRPAPTDVLLDPIQDPRWRALCQEQPSLLFHSPAWLRVLGETYGFSIQALALFEKTLPVAGMPFAVIEDALGPRLVSLAFSDYCDPIFQRRSQLRSLLTKLLQLFPDHPIRLRFLEAPAPASRLGFRQFKTARWHGLRLPGSETELWQSLHPQFRRAVALAKKQGVIVRPLRREELRKFFEMHLAVRKSRYRLLAQPFRFFENVWQAFVAAGQGIFLGAYTKEQRLIAAHCLLFWKDSLVYKFGASDYAFARARANHLLHWEGARIGRERGFRRFDLGLSDEDQLGLIRYKRHLGAEEKVIRFYERAGIESRPETAALRPLLAEITELATDPAVPDPIVEKFGNLLYRFFA